ncbi:hypothetical protein HZH68_003304 [Vespula germanica]|uniref:Uncharacterized protein n=1 Tax=Vespula germanica TaxID=30212 RepID=A0A834NP53_VESGE|nr:hypothetical protein HZH68_003304 [Vespula germanica]
MMKKKRTKRRRGRMTHEAENQWNKSCELFSSLQLFRKNLFIIHWTSNEVNSSGTFENKKQMRYLGVSEIRTEFKRYANIYDARIKSGVQVARRGRAARSQKVEKQKEEEEEEDEDEVEEEEEEEEEEDRPCAGRHIHMRIHTTRAPGDSLKVKFKSLTRKRGHSLVCRLDWKSTLVV